MTIQGLPENQANIIVLDDESELRQMLQHYLQAQGFRVQAIADSARLDVLLARSPWDLLILDLMMTPEDGLSVCRRIRAEGYTLPVLMLTARGDPVDRITGLESGADDYLAKPFIPQELLARVRAILRRQRMLGGENPAAPNKVRFGEFELDLAQSRLTHLGSPVEVNTAEISLLVALATTLNRPVSRDNLIARARGRSYVALDRSVDVQVLRIRKIIEQNPAEPRWLRTVWGKGYLLSGDVIA